MLRCSQCQQPRSTGSAQLCRSCYLGTGLTETERKASKKWLSSDQIPIDDMTKEYFVVQSQKRGLTFGEILGSILNTIADDDMAAAILEE